jgi:hypothetical protein
MVQTSCVEECRVSSPREIIADLIGSELVSLTPHAMDFDLTPEQQTLQMRRLNSLVESSTAT